MKTTSMPKMAFLVVCGLVMVGASGASRAGPIVTAWDYATDAIFSVAQFTNKPFVGYTGTTTHTNYELSWGGDGASFEIGGHRCRNRDRLQHVTLEQFNISILRRITVRDPARFADLDTNGWWSVYQLSAA